MDETILSRDLLKPFLFDQTAALICEHWNATWDRQLIDRQAIYARLIAAMEGKFQALPERIWAGDVHKLSRLWANELCARLGWNEL